MLVRIGGLLGALFGDDFADGLKRDFAANVGIAFLTPEEYFLVGEQRPFRRAFDLEALLRLESGDLICPAFEKKHDQELVLLCGSPGAGKSTFYHNILQPLGYKRVNQDILKSVGLIWSIKV